LRRVTRGRTGATESEHEEEESTDVLSDGGDEVCDESRVSFDFEGMEKIGEIGVRCLA
jgi:hypothetical protein